jgi:hypothetical protein
LFNQNNSGIFTKEEQLMTKELEEKKRKLLEWEDEKWRMKSKGGGGNELK